MRSGSIENMVETMVSSANEISIISSRNDDLAAKNTSWIKKENKTIEDIEVAKVMAETAPQEHSPCLTSANSYFLEDMEWMAENSNTYAGLQQGKLYCSNPKCKRKVGNWSWIGFQCDGCSVWMSPAFRVHRDKVDELPIIIDGKS